ncbi:hypothetical protein DA102_033425 [Sinorhizobium meliloti]|nr:hypothetical protein DA102_033425 [Sinorhizobium meliloti]
MSGLHQIRFGLKVLTSPLSQNTASFISGKKNPGLSGAAGAPNPLLLYDGAGHRLYCAAEEGLPEDENMREPSSINFRQKKMSRLLGLCVYHQMTSPLAMAQHSAKIKPFASDLATGGALLVTTFLRADVYDEERSLRNF